MVKNQKFMMVRGYRTPLLKHNFDVNTPLMIKLLAEGDGVYDAACFCLDESEHIADEKYIVFYNQLQSGNGEITLSQNSGEAVFDVQLGLLPENLRKLVFVLSIDGEGSMSQARLFSASVSQGGIALELSLAGADFFEERAVIALELYLKDVWRLAAVGAGFTGGLDALVKRYGGVVAEEAGASGGGGKPGDSGQAGRVPGEAERLPPPPDLIILSECAAEPSRAPVESSERSARASSEKSAPDRPHPADPPSPSQPEPLAGVLDLDDDWRSPPVESVDWESEMEATGASAGDIDPEWVIPSETWIRESLNSLEKLRARTKGPVPSCLRKAGDYLEHLDNSLKIKALNQARNESGLAGESIKFALALCSSLTVREKFQNGFGWELIDRIAPMAKLFCGDGELDVWVDVKKVTPISQIDIFKQQNVNDIMSKIDISFELNINMLGQILDFYSDKRYNIYNKYIIFINDGLVTENQNLFLYNIQKRVGNSIMMHFINLNANCNKFFKKLETLNGIIANNCMYTAFNNFENISYLDFYRLLLSKYRTWVDSIAN